jgi:hypothetical protein
MNDLFFLKQTDIFKNYPDHKSLDNVLNAVYDNYYKDWPQRIIIDRGPVMTPNNFALMQKYFKRPFKCIVLLRDVKDVLASYMKWYTENSDAFPNRFGFKNDEEKLTKLMNKEGKIAKDLQAIKNSFNYPDICHFVKYDDLVARPKEEITKIYKFMEVPYYEHRFEDLQQVEVNGIKYEDTVVGKNMHKIRTVVRKEYNSYINKVPESLLKKYAHVKF